jgi:hypothetical protein
MVVVVKGSLDWRAHLKNTVKDKSARPGGLHVDAGTANLSPTATPPLHTTNAPKHATTASARQHSPEHVRMCAAVSISHSRAHMHVTVDPNANRMRRSKLNLACISRAQAQGVATRVWCFLLRPDCVHHHYIRNTCFWAQSFCLPKACTRVVMALTQLGKTRGICFRENIQRYHGDQCMNLKAPPPALNIAKIVWKRMKEMFPVEQQAPLRWP